MKGLPLYENEEYEFKGYFMQDSGQQITDGSVITGDCVLIGIWEQTGE